VGTPRGLDVPCLQTSGWPCQHCIQGWISCQDLWKDNHQQGHLPSYLVVVPGGSLQPVEDSLPFVAESHQPVEDSCQAEEGSRLAAVGSLLLVEGKLQVEVGMHQVVEGKPQAVVGIRLPEGGIQGSSWFSLLGLFLVH